MNVNVNSVDSFILKAQTLSPRRRRRIQRLSIWWAKRRGLISEADADQLVEMDWEDFLDWLMENGPEIIEFIMLLISLF